MNIYVYLLRYIYIYIYICIDRYMYTYIYVYVYMYVYVYVYVYMYIYIYVCLSLYIYMYIYVYICINMHLYMYTYLYIYIYIYTCITKSQLSSGKSSGSKISRFGVKTCLAQVRALQTSIAPPAPQLSALRKDIFAKKLLKKRETGFPVDPHGPGGGRPAGSG